MPMIFLGAHIRAAGRTRRTEAQADRGADFILAAVSLPAFLIVGFVFVLFPFNSPSLRKALVLPPS